MEAHRHVFQLLQGMGLRKPVQVILLQSLVQLLRGATFSAAEGPVKGCAGAEGGVTPLAQHGGDCVRCIPHQSCSVPTNLHTMWDDVSALQRQVSLVAKSAAQHDHRPE